MATLASDVSRDETFERRRTSMESLVAELRERSSLVAAGGGEKAVERHRSRGKLTARERIDRLVDPRTAFLELNALAAWQLYEGDAPSAGTFRRLNRMLRLLDLRSAAGDAPSLDLVRSGLPILKEIISVSNDIQHGARRSGRPIGEVKAAMLDEMLAHRRLPGERLRVEAAATLKKDNPKPANFSGFWFPGQDWRNGAAFVWSAGGDLAVDDGGEWTGSLSSPESVAGLEMAQQLAPAGAPIFYLLNPQDLLARVDYLR